MKSITEKLRQDNLINDELNIEMSGDETGILITQCHGDDSVFIQPQHFDDFIEKLKQVKESIQ